MSYAPDSNSNTSAPSYIAPYPPQPYQPYAAGTSAAGASGSGAAEPTSTRRADELARKDRTLAEFMLMLDEYDPLIPNEVTDYYLQRAGFECDDVRLKRLLSLAAQKFVSDIAADAYQHARIRTNAQPAARVRTDKAGTTATATALARDKTRTVLTMDDLSAALSEYGINARKPDFYL
ncbi:transcription initiation factor IID, TAF10 subunit [Ceratobasidium sp. AG-I]|nr:transcription initiation factor IID, TAF10 subunit [Ceratobasidium sp. AG-I]